MRKYATLALRSEAVGPKSGVIWFSGGDVAGGEPWRSHDISGPEGVTFDLVETIDMDADGDLDVVTCAEVTGLGVVWYENPARQP